MAYSKVQIHAITQIDKVLEHFGKGRWFTQTEIVGVGGNTMNALEDKKYIRGTQVNGVQYYQVIA